MSDAHEEISGSGGASHSHERRSAPWMPAVVVGVVIALVAAGAALAGVAVGRNQTNSGGGRITVTATAAVTGRPDTASFQIGVDTTRATATMALKDNDSRAAALEKALEAVGVKKAWMQTSNVSVDDNYNDSGQVISYTADDTLSVSIPSIAIAARAITAGARVAGNGIEFYGVTFSISNASGLRQRARIDAVHHAARSASELASAAGATLGAVERITLGEHTSSPVIMPFGELAQAAAANTVPLKAGTQSVSVTVTITYQLNG